MMMAAAQCDGSSNIFMKKQRGGDGVRGDQQNAAAAAAAAAGVATATADADADADADHAAKIIMNRELEVKQLEGKTAKLKKELKQLEEELKMKLEESDTAKNDALLKVTNKKKTQGTEKKLNEEKDRATFEQQMPYGDKLLGNKNKMEKTTTSLGKEKVLRM